MNFVLARDHLHFQNNKILLKFIIKFTRRRKKFHAHDLLLTCNSSCADVNPKKFCDVPPLKERRDLQLPENSECVAHDVAVAVCTDRLCRSGSSSACCEPDDKEEIPVVYICPDGRSQERRVRYTRPKTGPKAFPLMLLLSLILCHSCL